MAVGLGREGAALDRRCGFCRGDGRCGKCRGTGKLHGRPGWFGRRSDADCHACAGSGVCGLCHGSGEPKPTRFAAEGISHRD